MYILSQYDELQEREGGDQRGISRAKRGERPFTSRAPRATDPLLPCILCKYCEFTETLLR